MFQAFLYGSISALALVIGAVLGVYAKWSQKIIAAVMAFGSGTLICALTFGLMDEAYHKSSLLIVAFGFFGGGVIFLAGNYLLSIFGGRRHRLRQSVKPLKEASGSLIVLGALLDGIPESIALGVALFTGTSQGILILVALFLSNLPESLSSVPGLLREGFTQKRILLMWGVVALVTALMTVFSYYFFNNIDLAVAGLIEALAAGAILAMISDAMIPEAYLEGGPVIGLLTVLGFLVSFILSRF